MSIILINPFKKNEALQCPVLNHLQASLPGEYRSTARHPFFCNTEKWNKIRLSTFDAMSGLGILVFQLRIVFLARNYYLQGYGCGELYAPVYQLIDNY